MFKKTLALAAAAALLLSASGGHAYTIAWMSDTQQYASGYGDTFYAMTDWIVQNRDTQDIRYVFHTGDIVSASKSDKQWELAGDALSAVTEADIPLLAVTGNHDTGARASYSRYMDYVGNQQPQQFQTEFGQTGSRYELFSDENNDYIFLGIAYGSRGPSEEETAWANEVLARYPERAAVILTHSYLKRSGAYTTQGSAIFKNIVQQNPNVFLVLCGHCRGVSSRLERIDDDGDGKPDRSVYAMLANYQSVGRGGNGYMRLLSFGKNSLRISTYSPTLNSYDCPKQKLDTVFVPLP